MILDEFDAVQPYCGYVGKEGRGGGYLVLNGAEPDHDYQAWEVADRAVRPVLGDGLTLATIYVFPPEYLAPPPADTEREKELEEAFDAGRTDALNGRKPDVGALDESEYMNGYGVGIEDRATLLTEGGDYS